MRQLFIIYVIVIAMFVASMLLNTRTAEAAEGDITIHTVSTHIGVSGLNNINPGVAYDVTDRLRVGVLRNSFKKPSAYAALMWALHDRVHLGVGVISGYGIEDGAIIGKTAGIIPLLAVELDITDHVSVVWMGQAINLELKL